MTLIMWPPLTLHRSLYRYATTFRNYATLKTVLFNSAPSPKTIHDINTNVLKDVILFKYENPRFFKYMNIFAVVQYGVWSYLGIFVFNNLRDTPVDKSVENSAWYMKINLGENKFKNTLAIIALFIGSAFLGCIWMYTLRSVRYLILNKGGNHVTFVTYAPFGENRIMKVPLKYVNCRQNRTDAPATLPIKVKDIWLHYMLDMRGEFKNLLLFDSTAGLARKF